MADVLLSADCHMVEPGTLWSSRLPKEHRDNALRWEYRAHPDGPRVGRHAGSDLVVITLPDGSQFWNTRFRHANGEQMDSGGDPAECFLQDLEADGVSGALLLPNLGLMGCFILNHELAFAHARAYNDYAHEYYGGHRDRIVVAAPIPLTDPGDAVAEIERVANLGFRAITCPVIPPQPFHTSVYDKVWAAAHANGLTVTFHSFTGVAEDSAKSGDYAAASSTNEMAPEALFRGDGGNSHILDEQAPHAQRLREHASGGDTAEVAMTSLIGSGVMERFPDLHFVFVEFNAYWLVSLCAAMDKAYTLGIGQDGEWQVGCFAGDNLIKFGAFEMNDKWPYPLRPSEYVRRQVHVSFQDDPLALACRHLTGVSSILWGNDYPHAEGTFPRSQEAIDQQFANVDATDRSAILGGTTAALFNLDLASLA